MTASPASNATAPAVSGFTAAVDTTHCYRAAGPAPTQHSGPESSAPTQLTNAAIPLEFADECGHAGSLTYG